MIPRVIAISAFALISSGALFAQDVANYSGTWKSDPSRSESAHWATSVGPITLIISQTPTSISIETRTSPKDKELIANERLVFKLDGSENTMPGNAQVPVLCKARWEDGNLVTETARNLNGSTLTTHWVLALDPAGKELTLKKTLMVQHGYQWNASMVNTSGNATDIFVKVRAEGKK